jgi:hypothetical protein
MSSYGSIQLSTARWERFNWTIEHVERKDTFLGFGICKGMYSWNLRIPHWFPVAITAALAAGAWPYWTTRFSLRTLLIATTLVAVVLGLVRRAAN